MAKKTKTVPAGGKLAGVKVAFVGKFGYGGRELAPMHALVAEEGGSVVDPENAAPDYLVAGTGVGGNPPAAVAKIQKKHPQVHVIDQAGLYQLLMPTAEEFLASMASGPHGREYRNALLERLRRGGAVLDLSGSDLRNLTVAGTLYMVCVDGCDFRGAKISAHFGNVKGAKFDRATMTGGSFAKADDCSLKNVTMENVRWNPTHFKRCDFSGAKLHVDTGSFTTAIDCSFRKADLSGSDLERSTFTGTDFSGANLTGARLAKCDFTGANLAGADFSRADLRGARFGNADLRKAKFKDALLSGAELAGAIIDGADFTGANVTGANVTGLDLTKANNLEERAARTAGPNMGELARAARGAKQVRTSIEVDLGQDEFTTLNVSLNQSYGGAYLSANFTHWKQNATQHSTYGNYVDATSFEQGMLNLTDLWSHGAPKFDTVKVDAKGATFSRTELRDLAVAAWHEAYGLAVPSKEELEKAAEQSASERASLREAMIAELSAGDVRKWNQRSQKERSKLGKLRKHNFANTPLAGADLSIQDLEGCTFDGADLTEAKFSQSKLKGASFVGAKLSEANFALCKCSEASFVGANLTTCNLRSANFRCCNFQDADLSNADFAYSDLCGADFSSATLDGAKFASTRFDDKSVFPPGFVPPEGLDWKGVGSRPGTPAPPPPLKSGTLDFDTFLEQLNNKVEAARLQKAGSMLKAERFQLFAEVKDDSLVGIVKSQSSQDLVYSCRLASDGAFGCCTQNLRPCGGLRGALCKHLLVLIVGLAKANELDSATVDGWIDLSRTKKPTIEEESMSATFLRYKGAEAGEIDWRPTETIPEDFYAM